MSRSFDHQEKDKLRAARANFFGQQKRKLSTDNDAELDITLSSPVEAQPGTMSSGKRFKFPGITFSKSDKSPSKIPFIVSFYDVNIQARDAHGRTMEDILEWPDRQLEACHNYIQMLFPVPEGSAFNWEAPIIDREVMDAFRSSEELRAQLRRSFERMVDFYGFTVTSQLKPKEEESESVEEPTSDAGAVAAAAATPAERMEEGGEQPKEDKSKETETTKPIATDSEATEKELPSLPDSSHPAGYYIVRGPKWPRNSRNWAVRFDHNHLRITRILRCLRVLGLQVECDAFFAALMDVFGDPAIRISERSMMYWRRAVTRPIYIAPDDDLIDWLKEWDEAQRHEQSGKLSK